jgi:uncharacterized protein (DUF608 family)
MPQRDKIGRTFDSEHLLQIAMPMGGLGGGCICLNGIGGIVDFSIRNNPNATALPDNFNFTDAAFALLHVKGKEPITRLIEGPLEREKLYDQGLQCQGFRKAGFEGLPRFAECEFTASYPSGEVRLSDPAIPLTVKLTGWSPFIPLDDRTTGMPAAILEYQFTNTSAKPVDFEFSYHLSHLARGQSGWNTSRNAVIDGGIHFYNTEPTDAQAHASASLTVIGHQPVIKGMWTRGQWFDWIAALWREVSNGEFRPNPGNTDRDLDGHNGGSILLPARLEPGASITFPIAITWHTPNVYWSIPLLKVPGPHWHNFSAGQWSDAADVAKELQRDFDSIRGKTFAFRDAIHQSTLPPDAVDAIASNLAILKSPTVLRQKNGNLWGWEGCFTTYGSCHGTCTHVWNYAQALPHLFPALERTLREQELMRSMREDGHVIFRSAIPDGPPEDVYIVSGKQHAAADGQLGGVMKVYRDWQISGDRQWLQKLYPLVKRSIDYCIRTWDPDHRGLLFEPHHNTYDIEFWGPDGMCTSIYLGALAAMEAMAKEMNDPHHDLYQQLYNSGAKLSDEQLFNGEYYQQKVEWEDLHDQSFIQRLQSPGTMDADALRILKEEGPSYQYGPGCLSDGVIGIWMAKFYGLKCGMNPTNIRSTLAAIHRHNFKPDLSEHACTQRPGYANGHEPGLLLCTWPRGGHPTLPFVYSDEVWTGVEYHVAAHLISEGMTEQGLEIVSAARSRYDGRKRNPFNEYECGSYYARAMSSYALLQALSGFRYSLVTRTLWFDPKLPTRPWKSFFCTATGYGTIGLDDHTLLIELLIGELQVDQLVLFDRTMAVSAKVTAGRPHRIEI